jgi:AraC-like DNA-binding protein
MHTPTVFARSIEIAVATAAVRARSTPAAVCARAGIDLSILGDPAARVSHELLVRAWDELAAGDEAFGLKAARLVETMGRSLVEYAILNAADMLGALAGFVRFQRTMHDASAHAIEQRAASVVLRLGLAPPLALPALVAEYIAATLVLRFRALLRDPVEPIELRLSRRPFADPSLAEAIFRAPIAYDSPRVEIHWPRHALDRPLAASDPTLHFVLVRQLERALGLPAEAPAPSHGRAGDDVIPRLKRALRVELGRGDGSLGKVARAVAMSGRSLERRLSERGTSFQAVRDEVRRAIAEELLVARGASVAEAAFAVGFSEVAPFTRAFRRWTGMAPSEFLRKKAFRADAAASRTRDNSGPP